MHFSPHKFCENNDATAAAKNNHNVYSKIPINVRITQLLFSKFRFGNFHQPINPMRTCHWPRLKLIHKDHFEGESQPIKKRDIKIRHLILKKIQQNYRIDLTNHLNSKALRIDKTHEILKHALDFIPNTYISRFNKQQSKLTACRWKRACDFHDRSHTSCHRRPTSRRRGRLQHQARGWSPAEGCPGWTWPLLGLRKWTSEAVGAHMVRSRLTVQPLLLLLRRAWGWGWLFGLLMVRVLG